MRLHRGILLVATLVFVCTAKALSLDMAHVTCRALATASNDDMAELIMWLRGYHAGKTGDMASTDTAEFQEYGLGLGSYCKTHMDDLAINASEKILAEQHRGTSEDHNQSAGLSNSETGSEAGGKSVEPTLAVAPTGSIHLRSRPAAPLHSRRASTARHHGRTRHARRSS